MGQCLRVPMALCNSKMDTQLGRQHCIAMDVNTAQHDLMDMRVNDTAKLNPVSAQMFCRSTARLLHTRLQGACSTRLCPNCSALVI